MSWVLFFDGDCAFCSAAVRRVADADGRGRVEFAPLQGRLAAELGFGKHADRDQGTMVLWREVDDRVFLRGDAVAEIGLAVGGVWRILAVLRWVPGPLRDGIYTWIARNRKRLPGGSDGCRLPDEAMRARLRD